MISKVKVVLALCILFVIAPLWVYAKDTVSVKCHEAYVQDETGVRITYTSNGKYRGAAQITASGDCKVVFALAVFEAETHELKDISYEIKEVTEGNGFLYTSYLPCDESRYMRLFIWKETLEPICADYIFSPKDQFGSIASASLTANGKSYKGFVNPDDKTVMFDVGNLSEEYLSDAKLLFETDDSVFPDTKENAFDLTQKLQFIITGSNGEPMVYTVEAFNSEIRRMYDCEGAKIYTSDQAASLWGGEYRSGAPSWISTETAGSGAWFIEPDGSHSGGVTVETGGTNDYLCLNKTSPDNDFVLWSGDNKVTGTVSKIHASFKFKVDSFTPSDFGFASFNSGAADEIVLTGHQDGGYFVAYKNTDGKATIFEHSPLLSAGTWHSIDYIFERHQDTGTTEDGYYSGYGVYVYLDGKYIGRCPGVSVFPADYTGYLTMNSFSDSTYSVLRLCLTEGTLSQICVDDVLVTAAIGDAYADSSKCAADQRVFLASYWASKNYK